MNSKPRNNEALFRSSKRPDKGRHITKEMAVTALRAHPSNVHVHPKKQIRLLVRLIKQFGFTVPIIVDEKGIILAGHGRWLAAQELGLQPSP